MGKAYKLQCRVCGAEFTHSSEMGYGLMQVCVGCGDQSDAAQVVKCPGCHHSMAIQSEEFRSQIVEECIWE